ncbi:MAG TPA: hypothetical protein VL916_13835 [Ilumatobacteraceae bacterium]|nr:hypothetical protein [Ilumatobacteraceae bacterium]
MADVAVRNRLAPLLAALLVVAGACSGDDDDAGTATDGVSTAATTRPSSEVTTPDASSNRDTAARSDPLPTAPSAPPPTAGPADTGVPGLDSEDAFCSAWSRFGGSWQLLLQAGAAADPAQVARLEVIASTVVQDGYDDVLAALPAELDSERDVVADAYFGAFRRRSADAAAALADAGATDADVAALAQAWDAALAQYDPSSTVDVVVPPELEPTVDQAATAFSAARVPLQVDPSMVITAETPLTDAFLATACPDEGWIVGQDVVDDGA